MEEQTPPAAAAPTPKPRGRGLWIGIAVAVVVVVIVLALVLGGFLVGAKPEAIFFVGYPGEGDKLIPTWWNNRVTWPAQWLYSEGLKDDLFMGRLKTAGVNLSTIEGTAPTAPLNPDPNYTASATIFQNEYTARFGHAASLYGPNSYDAMFILALAFQKAQTTDTNSSAFKSAMRFVANPPGIGIRPGEWQKAKENLTAGNDIDYQGASGSVDLDQYGEVGSDYEVWNVNATGATVQKLFIPQGSWVSSSSVPSVATTSVISAQQTPTLLPIGTLFDLSGALKDFGQDQQNGTILAAEDVTAGGDITIGSTEYTLDLHHEDDATNAATASAAATKLVNQDHIKALVGGTASSASAAAFAVIAPAGIIEITSSSTSAIFTLSDTTDQFWRTAPSDALQGRAAGWYAFTQRGWRTMSILYVDNAYGRGLSTIFTQDFVGRGGKILRAVAFPEDPTKVDANSVLQTLFTPGQASAAIIALYWRKEG